MKKRAIIGYSITGVIIIAFILTLVRFGPFQSKVTQLQGVEVKEYQGQDLSSVNDFRENSIAGPQYIDINDYKLEITGLVAKPLTLTYDEVINGNKLYQKVVRLNCVEGWAVNILWEGVLVRDILAPADPLPAATTVIFHCYDGYTTSEPIEYFTDHDIIMAYKMNDVTVPPERGYPFVLVAEDKWGYKWAKWITQIELSDDTSYRGFWESNGYSNSGNLGESQFEY